MTNNDELLIDVLRAAGHEDAANLAAKLNAATAKQNDVETPDPVAQTPDPIDAQGAAIAAALKNLTPWHAGGSL